MKAILISLLMVFGFSTKTLAKTTFGFEFSPILALVGIINPEFNLTVTPNVDITAGFVYASLKITDVDINLTGYRAGARYNFSGTHNDGWYAQGGFQSVSAEASTRSSITNEKLTAKVDSPSTYVGAGYAWYWTNFYQRLGLDLHMRGKTEDEVTVRNSNGSEEKVKVSGGATSAMGLVYNIGWRF